MGICIGAPKGVVRDNGGHAVALRWSMEHIMKTNPGEVYFTASDIGWGVGPPYASLNRLFVIASKPYILYFDLSYIVYAPLLRGSTSVLYEGKPVGTPDPGQF